MTTLLNNVSGHPLPDDLRVSVALNNHKGWRGFRKFGMNPDVDTGTEEVWALGGIRTLPTSAAVASVVSDSAADDDGSTGALTVGIRGLDEDWNEIEETVTLNGTTPVLTTQTFLRINRTFVATSGTGQTNAGNITTSIGGDAQSYIEANEGQCHCCNYSVPAGHTLIVDYYTNVTGRQSSSTDIHFLGQIMTFGSNTWRSISDVYNFQVQYLEADATVAIVPEKSDVRVLCVTNSTNNVVSAQFGGFVVLNTQLNDPRNPIAT